MRVIAGTAKSLPLKSIPGMDTRPTTDRTKETLFNMLQPYIQECRFLDLFSGSGAIGIEALSRGADHCVFVEQNKAAVNCIKDNLQFTKLTDRAQVISGEAMMALRQLEGEVPFTCIFMDPPYNMGIEREVLEILKGVSYLSQETILIIEASLETNFDYLDKLGYEIYKKKKYKNNMHIFVRVHKEKTKC